jgi:hypothetical protein
MWTSSWVFNSVWVENLNKAAFNTFVSDSDYVYYSDCCFYSSSLFWCVWLKSKSYCILNKEYTKEEYNKIVPQIIEHMQETWEWSKFFPNSLSPFWYNDTVAQEYFPSNKEDTLKEWFKRSDYETPFPKVDKIIKASELEDDIKDVSEDILKNAIECEITKKPFRIIKTELEFYKKYNLPLPRVHMNQRFLNRMNLRNWRKLYKRECDKCWINIQTTYSPDNTEKVYCEKCYNKEIY